MSLLNRLKSKSIKSGRSYQLCLQLFCQEEFLRRVEKSKYAKNLILKGGLFIYALTKFDSRATIDIDFLIRNLPNQIEKMRIVIENIVNIDTGNDFVLFEIIKIDEIAIHKKYIGIGVSLIAKIKNTRTPIKIDFGVGDVIVPKQEEHMIPTQLSGFDEPRIFTYSIETVIAEKLDAILSLMMYSSRMKDYYDIYYLAKKFNFDGKTLTDALQKVFDNRNHEHTLEQLEEVKKYYENESMLQKWNAFTRKIDSPKLNLKIVLDGIDKFLKEPFQAVVSRTEYHKEWLAEGNKWI